jgi:hypothetical protein
MIFNYISKDEFMLDNGSLQFGESRVVVREKIGRHYQEDNQIIDEGSSETEEIFLRRDIYEYYDSTKSYFFLSYDKHDFLSEIEIHQCTQMKIFDIVFDFNSKLDTIASQLAKYAVSEKRGTGEILLKDLNVLMMDKKTMGGQGHTLGYFYCAADIDHLTV